MDTTTLVKKEINELKKKWDMEMVKTSINHEVFEELENRLNYLINYHDYLKVLEGCAK